MVYDVAVFIGLLLTVPGMFSLFASLVTWRNGHDLLHRPTGRPMQQIYLLYAALLLGTAFILFHYGYAESDFNSPEAMEALGFRAGFVGAGILWLM